MGGAGGDGGLFFAFWLFFKKSFFCMFFFCFFCFFLFFFCCCFFCYFFGCFFLFPFFFAFFSRVFFFLFLPFFFVLFVAACPMLIARAHTYPVQCSSQRVGALLIHRPAWVDQHTGGSRLTPTVHRCPKGMAVGGPNTVQHSSTVQKHGKHGSGAMSIQGKNVGSKSTVDESLLCYDGPEKRRTH